MRPKTSIVRQRAALQCQLRAELSRLLNKGKRNVDEAKGATPLQWTVVVCARLPRDGHCVRRRADGLSALAQLKLKNIVAPKD
jgi:hypothetical protein